MRSYKIESYVPEKGFLTGKDARFCRTAFEDCFVIDLHETINILASCSGADKLELSMADAANLAIVFGSREEVVMLPYHTGTLLVYPVWRHLEMALAFLVKESPDEVEKTYKNAQRHAFSAVFVTEEADANAKLETKLCVLDFYNKHLFGNKHQTNVTAQILMLANLLGCHLHEMSVSRVKDVTLDEREFEKLSAYLACAFVTMRRYNAEISASAKNDQNTANFAHVSQEYGVYIQQNLRQKIAKPTAFDVPQESVLAPFVNHPAFADYKAEETNGGICLHLPIRQKALLSSLSSLIGERELVLTLFPLK